MGKTLKQIKTVLKKIFKSDDAKFIGQQYLKIKGLEVVDGENEITITISKEAFRKLLQEEEDENDGDKG